MDTGLNMNLAAAAVQQERAAHFSRFWKAATVFAVLYVVCLYKNHSGITYPFFMPSRLW